MNRSFFEDDQDMGVEGPPQHLGGGYGGGNFGGHGGRRGAPPGETARLYEGAHAFSHDPDPHAPHPSQGWAGSAVSESMGPSGSRRAVGRMPKDYLRSDTRIQDDVWEHLYHRHDLDLTDVRVQVEGATVRLEGSVMYRAMKHRIEDVAAACMGVRDVDNRLRVRRREDESASRP